MDFRQIVDGGDRLVLIIISGNYAEKNCNCSANIKVNILNRYTLYAWGCARYFRHYSLIENRLRAIDRTGRVNTDGKLKTPPIRPKLQRLSSKHTSISFIKIAADSWSTKLNVCKRRLDTRTGMSWYSALLPKKSSPLLCRLDGKPYIKDTSCMSSWTLISDQENWTGM